MQSIGSFLKSALLLKRCERIDRIVLPLNNIIIAFRDLTHENFENIDEYLTSTLEFKDFNGFEDIIDELEENLNSDSIILSKTKKIKRILNEKKSYST